MQEAKSFFVKTTIFLAALYLVFGFFACKKGEDDNVQTISYQQFDFSKSYGFSGIIKNYRLVSGKLYRLPGGGTQSPKDTVQLSAAQWNAARPLVNSFPTFLIKAGSSSYGCSNCTDQGAINIIVKDNSGTRSWQLDNDPNYVPDPVKNYVMLANSVVEQL